MVPNAIRSYTILNVYDRYFISSGCRLQGRRGCRGCMTRYFTQFAPLPSRLQFFTVIEQFPGVMRNDAK